jgi:hypothetical protein
MEESSRLRAYGGYRDVPAHQGKAMVGHPIGDAVQT